MPKPKKKDIENSMIETLKTSGHDQEVYMDLIGDYMKLWSIKNKLLTDISKRGIVYKDKSSTGVEMIKNNPSTKELMLVNRQMLQILEKLGLTDLEIIRGGIDDDSL